MGNLIHLPAEITLLVDARNGLRARYGESGLAFTLDGKLVGDIGEAIAMECFGITLTSSNGRGIDGEAPDGRTVQVKTTITGRGPAFRWLDPQCRATNLLFFSIDAEKLSCEVVFNGLEETALSKFPKTWLKGQRSLTMKQIRDANSEVPDDDRLPMLNDTAVSEQHRRNLRAADGDR